MSGILGSLFAGGGASLAGMTGLLTQLLSTGQGAAGGGLPSLVEQLEMSGLGTQVRSWIGHGDNLPVHPDQLTAALPPEQLEKWAAETGMSVEQLLQALAHVLPHAVDAATPHGELSAPDAQAAAQPNPEGSESTGPTHDLAGLITRLLGR
jgi:uncharacterized protein YidB (DUF937 family)